MSEVSSTGKETRVTMELDLADLAQMLAPTLGLEKASEVVNGAASELGVKRETLGREETHQILDRLGEAPGLIGLTASLAKSRLHFQRASRHLGK